MGSITTLAEFFLISVSFSMTAFLHLIDVRKTGSGFIRLVSSISFVSCLLASGLYLAAGPIGSRFWVYAISLVCSLLAYLFHGEEKTTVMKGLHLLNVFAITLAVYEFGTSWKPSLFCLSSALLLGPVTFLMILGHWYLVTPKLSVQPLKTGLKYCWIVLLMKIIWSTFNSLQNADYFAAGTMEAGGYAFNWMMLLMRYLWGYLVIGVMSYYTWRLVKIRSTQSATGILYAMTFFVFVGELISIYLHFTYGLYI